MRYGDLLAKLASGQQLTEGEQNELRLQGNRIGDAAFRSETLGGPAGGLSPEVFQNSGGFSISPITSCYVNMSSAQSIPNDDDTPILFADGDMHGANGRFRWSSAVNPDWIETNLRGTNMVLVVGSVEFAYNSSGARAVTVNTYTAADAFYNGHTFAEVGGQTKASVATVVPFAGVWPFEGGMSHFKIGAYQNSGAALNINYAQLTAIQLR